MLRGTDLLNWVPILTPRFCFTGLQKTEIGLVVGIDAGHDFDVGAELPTGIGVGQIAVPRVPEFVIAPGPLLLSGRDVMVGIMNDAGFRRVIVAAKEIFLRTHAHVGRGHGDVRVPAQVIWRIGQLT